ncbi:hypothetical protein KUTeg_004517 [Tegillarca granosa]|uniref:Uncharacterized protein n=1 Tax=Tegillarca granosa TaxID=220873 RepID=A0ABQ9FRR2_TEGGR|nr:hypothetical protein KUTeg_004517 [Tegillarca granosa]
MYDIPGNKNCLDILLRYRCDSVFIFRVNLHTVLCKILNDFLEGCHIYNLILKWKLCRSVFVFFVKTDCYYILFKLFS